MLGKLASYFQLKQDCLFTGGIKIGFENGRPVSISETTSPEYKAGMQADADKLQEAIKKACTPGYYGTIFCQYQDGQIKELFCNQTWQGAVLDAFLSGQCLGEFPELKVRRLLVVKTKGV